MESSIRKGASGIPTPKYCHFSANLIIEVFFLVNIYDGQK
ncbi:uncharacterized protein G2W53_011472 [Senna tora]|uniref:Uncharacterized protein n=1 Tax=Senna tora TaxID=362788 RepID=A0A834X1U1_9FABA|nr:uncharacterized protein G2W53_011472 [Senna tora]